MPPYPFLSEEWIAEVRALRDEYGARPSVLPLPPVRANLVVTDVPHGDGTVLAHSDSSGGELQLDLGHLDDPDFTITMGYQTAKLVLIGQRPEVVAKEWLFGRIKVEGDLTKVLPTGTDPLSALQGVDVDALLAADPAAAEMAERLRALTA